MESEDCKIFWGFPIQTEKILEHNRPDITVKKKKVRNVNYCELKYEIPNIWKMREVKVIPVVMGALGKVTKHFEKWIEKLDLRN